MDFNLWTTQTPIRFIIYRFNFESIFRITLQVINVAVIHSFRDTVIIDGIGHVQSVLQQFVSGNSTVVLGRRPSQSQMIVAIRVSG
ncbi:hypothetical protein D3C81_682790 [compost metagenome]